MKTQFPQNFWVQMQNSDEFWIIGIPLEMKLLTQALNPKVSLNKMSLQKLSRKLSFVGASVDDTDAQYVHSDLSWTFAVRPIKMYVLTYFKYSCNVKVSERYTFCTLKMCNYLKKILLEIDDTYCTQLFFLGKLVNSSLCSLSSIILQ